MGTNSIQGISTQFDLTSILQRTYETAMAAAAESFEAEVGDMRALNEDKSFADGENLRRKREDLEAFKDAENQVSDSGHGVFVVVSYM